MTTPEALFGVVPFGRVDFGEEWHGKASARPERGSAWHGIWRGLARPGKARQGAAGHGMDWGSARRGVARCGWARLGVARQGMECGAAWFGVAGRGGARQGTWAGTSARTTNQHNPMDTTHSKALMAYAGQLYDAYMRGCGGIDWLDKPLPSWADYVCNPNNKRRVEAWVDVARVAIKIETEVRDGQL